MTNKSLDKALRAERSALLCNEALDIGLLISLIDEKLRDIHLVSDSREVLNELTAAIERGDPAEIHSMALRIHAALRHLLDVNDALRTQNSELRKEGKRWANSYMRAKAISIFDKDGNLYAKCVGCGSVADLPENIEHHEDCTVRHRLEEVGLA